MRKALRRLKGYTGRVLRDIERQMEAIAEGPLKSRLLDLLALASRLLAQKPKDRRKLYSLGVETVKVFISGARRGVTRTIAKLLRRRSAIEPMIGHMKNDGRLTRSPLKGTTGDALFAVLCGCGHNIRMILRHLRVFLCQFIWLITLLEGFTRRAGRHRELQNDALNHCSG